MAGPDTGAQRRPASLPRRLALLAGGLVVGLVLAEILLQLAGVVVRQVAVRGGGDAAGDAVTRVPGAGAVTCSSTPTSTVTERGSDSPHGPSGHR